MTRKTGVVSDWRLLFGFTALAGKGLLCALVPILPVVWFAGRYKYATCGTRGVPPATLAHKEEWIGMTDRCTR